MEHFADKAVEISSNFSGENLCQSSEPTHNWHYVSIYFIYTAIIKLSVLKCSEPVNEFARTAAEIVLPELPS